MEKEKTLRTDIQIADIENTLMEFGQIQSLIWSLELEFEKDDSKYYLNKNKDKIKNLFNNLLESLYDCEDYFLSMQVSLYPYEDEYQDDEETHNNA